MKYHFKTHFNNAEWRDYLQENFFNFWHENKTIACKKDVFPLKELNSILVTLVSLKKETVVESFTAIFHRNIGKHSHHNNTDIFSG